MSRPPTLAATPLPPPWVLRTPRVPAASGLLEAGLSAHAAVALVRANARYWSSVAPIVREQLAHWNRRAHAIPDPALRGLALEKLAEEGFNAEVAATLATLAPPVHRRRVVKAIVALEIIFDYLDGLTEAPAHECPGAGERLFGAFTDAVSVTTQRRGEYFRDHPSSDTSGYLDELVSTVRFALAGLPAAARLSDLLVRAAARSGEAQLRIHSSSLAEPEQLERWATAQAVGTTLEWREFLAGAASSVLGAHALIVAAADRRTTRAQAAELDRAYLSISVLPTVLDSLIDYDRDASAGHPGYVRLYEDPEVLRERLERVVHDAVARARCVPNGPHHVMTIVGIVAYYTSAPTAKSAFARTATRRTTADLRPLIVPTLAVMHAWRAAKRLRGLGRRDSTAPARLGP